MSEQQFLEDLYSRNRRDLYAYLCRICGNADLALDLLQDSFLNLFEHYKAKPMPDDVSCRRILFRIARNLFINHTRSKASQTSSLEMDVAAQEAGSPDLTAKIQRLILGLPERERTAIVLRYLQSMKLEDIGAVLGLSVSASSRLIARAEKMLEWEAKKAGVELDGGA